jgi:hypothetical protein
MDIKQNNDYYKGKLHFFTFIVIKKFKIILLTLLTYFFDQKYFAPLKTEFQICLSSQKKLSFQ